MIEILQAILLGLVEGLTEFLPISSTAHLIISEYLLKLPSSDFLNFFTVFIQLGAISAVALLYYKRLLSGLNLYYYLLSSFIPAVILGLLLDDMLEALFQGYWFIAGSWIIGGLILIKIDTWLPSTSQDQEISQISYPQAIKIGFYQCIAMIPGVSRSGATIIGGRMVGLSHASAVEYSFLLGIPTILGASAKKMLDYKEHVSEFLFGEQSILLYIGFTVSFLVALLTIKWMVGLVTRFGFKYFGYYRIIVGLLLLIILAWK
jgi:undecaprenyl-diphosphatase